MKLLAISMLLALAACGDRIPDPRVEYPAPPAVLMEPAQDMKEIPQVERR